VRECTTRVWRAGHAASAHQVLKALIRHIAALQVDLVHPGIDAQHSTHLRRAHGQS